MLCGIHAMDVFYTMNFTIFNFYSVTTTDCMITIFTIQQCCIIYDQSISDQAYQENYYWGAISSNDIFIKWLLKENKFFDIYGCSGSKRYSQN